MTIAYYDPLAADIITLPHDIISRTIFKESQIHCYGTLGSVPYELILSCIIKTLSMLSFLLCCPLMLVALLLWKIYIPYY